MPLPAESRGEQIHFCFNPGVRTVIVFERESFPCEKDDVVFSILEPESWFLTPNKRLLVLSKVEFSAIQFSNLQ